MREETDNGQTDNGLQAMSGGYCTGYGCADEQCMTPPTLGLDINIRHMHIQTLQITNTHGLNLCVAGSCAQVQ